MALYDDSILVAAQAIIAEKYAKNEMRHQSFELIKLFKENSPYIVENVEGLRTSDQRSITAKYLKLKATDAVTVRAHGHTGDFGGSGSDALSFSIIGQPFKTSLKMGDRNLFNNAKLFSNQLESAWINMLNTLMTNIGTHLNTYKSQVNNATDETDLGDWDSTNHLWKIAIGQKDWFIQYITSMMQQNNYSGRFDVIADPVMFAIMQQNAAQGTQNATNKAFQYGDVNVHQLTSLTSTNKGSAYIMPQPAIGLIDWTPRANRENVSTKLYDYRTVMDPFGLGLVAAFHSYETGADNSSNGAETQDVNFEHELTLNYALPMAPDATSNEYPLMRTELLA